MWHSRLEAQMAMLSIKQKSAPSASASKMSVPRRIPPSKCTGTSPATALTVSGSAFRIDEMPSN